EYPPRTERNVRDSDGTLVLTCGEPDRGTVLTIRLADRHGKPCLVLDLDDGPAPVEILTWADANEGRGLNVAGPRERSRPGVGAWPRGRPGAGGRSFVHCRGLDIRSSVRRRRPRSRPGAHAVQAGTTPNGTVVGCVVAGPGPPVDPTRQCGRLAAVARPEAR